MQANQVLNKLGITRVTLSHYVKQGKIKVKKLSNGQYNYSSKSVEILYNIRNATCLTVVHGQQECLARNSNGRFVKHLEMPFMNDTKLSNTAKLLLYYVFTNPKEVKTISPYLLRKKLNVGYNKICNTIAELKKYGYLKMKRTGWSKWIYDIFYISILQKTIYNYYNKSKFAIDRLLTMGWSKLLDDSADIRYYKQKYKDTYSLC